MSAVKKPETIPIRTFEPAPDEPRYTPVDEMFSPPEWGPHEHSDADLRMMWSRIWRCFKSRQLCEGFLQFNRLHAIKVWEAAFEKTRQSKEKIDHIHYVKRVADTFSIKGTPSEVAARELKEAESMLRLQRNSAKYAVVDADDPDVRTFDRRSSVVPEDNDAARLMTLRFQNRNRGAK